MTTYIIYHQVKPGTDCPDGIAAAWVAHKEHPDAQIIGRCYSDDRPLPEFIEGDRIVIVDFSFPAAQIADWICAGIEVQVIDHHKTAWADLSTLEDFIVEQCSNSGMIAYGSQGDWGMSRHITSPKEGKRLASHIAFDMRHCGATLAWDIFNGMATQPVFLDYIHSRDLWLDCDLFKDPIPETLIVHEAIASFRHNLKSDNKTAIFEYFDHLATLTRTQLLEHLTPIGLPKLEGKRQQIEAIAQRAVFTDLKVPRAVETLDGDDLGFSDVYEIPVVALEQHEDRLTSDVCSKLYKTYPDVPFVACISSDGSWSLRSDRDGNNTDVGAIAKALGGGGHHNAAGFRPKTLKPKESSAMLEIQLTPEPDYRAIALAILEGNHPAECNSVGLAEALLKAAQEKGIEVTFKRDTNNPCIYTARQMEIAILGLPKSSYAFLPSRVDPE